MEGAINFPLCLEGLAADVQVVGETGLRGHSVHGVGRKSRAPRRAAVAHAIVAAFAVVWRIVVLLQGENPVKVHRGAQLAVEMRAPALWGRVLVVVLVRAAVAVVSEGLGAAVQAARAVAGGCVHVRARVRVHGVVGRPAREHDLPVVVGEEISRVQLQTTGHQVGRGLR